MWTAGVNDGVDCSPEMLGEGMLSLRVEGGEWRDYWRARGAFRFGPHCELEGERLAQRGEKVCQSDIIDIGAEWVVEGQRELFLAINDTNPG